MKNASRDVISGHHGSTAIAVSLPEGVLATLMASHICRSDTNPQMNSNTSSLVSSRVSFRKQTIESTVSHSPGFS